MSKIKRHIILLGSGLLFVAFGVMNMFDIDVTPAQVLLGVSEPEKGRVAATYVLHQYSQVSNVLSIYLTLDNQQQEGTIVYEVPKNTKVISDYLNQSVDDSDLMVHMSNSERGKYIYVNYSEKAFAKNVFIFKAQVPSNEKKVMGMYIFTLPYFSNNTKPEFPVKYAFFSGTSANVSVSGTLGEPSNNRANGYVWENLAEIRNGTTVSVETPSLSRGSQIALVFGAILIAVGINIITTHLYEVFRPTN